MFNARCVRASFLTARKTTDAAEALQLHARRALLLEGQLITSNSSTPNIMAATTKAAPSRIFSGGRSSSFGSPRMTHLSKAHPLQSRRNHPPGGSPFDDPEIGQCCNSHPRRDRWALGRLSRAYRNAGHPWLPPSVREGMQPISTRQTSFQRGPSRLLVRIGELTAAASGLARDDASGHIGGSFNRSLRQWQSVL